MPILWTGDNASARASNFIHFIQINTNSVTEQILFIFQFIKVLQMDFASLGLFEKLTFAFVFAIDW